MSSDDEKLAVVRASITDLAGQLARIQHGMDTTMGGVRVVRDRKIARLNALRDEERRLMARPRAPALIEQVLYPD